ncbi:MAG: hypothetical protein ACLPY1_13745 [Terracidiphilus sp.]
MLPLVPRFFFSVCNFQFAGVTPPNHIGYIQFPALLLILFGIMFLSIARDPSGRREWIPFGMGLKFAYFGVVFWHELHGGVPMLWIPWAWADLAFFFLFLAAWRHLRRQ